MSQEQNHRVARTITSSGSEEIAQKQKRSILKEETCTTLWCGTLIGLLFSGIVLAVIVTMFVRDQGRYTDKFKRGGVVLRWNATGKVVAGSGSGGAAGNPVLGPVGFTFDAMNRIYIAEYGGHRISRWVLGASNGTVVAGSINGIASNAPNGFLSPGDVLLESNGDMYITDRGNNRLQFWPNGASSATTLAGKILSASSGIVHRLDISLQGSGSNTSINLNAPCLLSRDLSTKEIYIASTHSHTIVSYPSGSVFGTTNAAGITADRLSRPEGVLFDSSTNSLIIANNGANSVVRWPLGSTNWTLIAGMPGVAGNDSIHLYSPIGVDVDPMGNIYVAEFFNRRVQLFMNGQSQGVTIAGSGINGTILGWTGAVKLDNQLNLYVSDYSQNRVMMFSRY